VLHLVFQTLNENVLFLFGDTNLMTQSMFTSDYNLEVCSKRDEIKTLLLLIKISIRRRCAGPILGAIPVIGK